MTNLSASNPSPNDDTLARWRDFQKSKLYDGLAALPVILWYGASAGALVPALAAEINRTDIHALDLHFVTEVLARTAAIALVITALVFLVLRGPAKVKSKGVAPRLVAIAGTYLSVLIVWLPQHPMNIALSFLSLFLMLGGAGFATFALLHLGRSFSLMPEARRLVTDGPYASIRHPLYVGEFLATLGLMLQYLSPLAVLIVVCVIALQFQRMHNEELVLSEMFPEYQGYRARTARLVPGVY